VEGVGAEEAYFTSLPDSVVKDDLTPSLSLIARVIVTGYAVPAGVIEKQLARRYLGGSGAWGE
jgi:hypothetical protein